MTQPYPIDVSASGCVLLGPDVVCDGFHFGAAARVQTHVHDDHMSGFESSKGFQTILMSGPTRDLLVSDLNADLPYRSNVVAVPFGSPHAVKGCEVLLLSSEHMLGSCQVQTELPSGVRVGYSGDFNWPLEQVIEVDALIVDSTYGSPDRVRRYTPQDTNDALGNLILEQLQKGPVHLKAFRGTLQRALEILMPEIRFPVVASEHLCHEIDVYRQFGYAIGDVFSMNSSTGRAIISGQNGNFIRLYSKGDLLPINPGEGCTVELSAYMAQPDEPILVFSDKAYRVALTNHADFEGTLEFVRATGAEFIVTDNSRGGHAIQLALEIQSRLGIHAQPSTLQPTPWWGD